MSEAFKLCQKYFTNNMTEFQKDSIKQFDQWILKVSTNGKSNISEMIQHYTVIFDLCQTRICAPFIYNYVECLIPEIMAIASKNDNTVNTRKCLNATLRYLRIYSNWVNKPNITELIAENENASFDKAKQARNLAMTDSHCSELKNLVNKWKSYDHER